ncbi:MAG: TraM recognition domain-containing protein [Collinsella sp.]
MRVLWFMQSLLQLQSVSGYSREEAETILDLLKDKVVLSCSNIETARKLSDSLGSYTALSESRSRTKGDEHTAPRGTSEGTVRRPLITPDELMRWTGRETGALVIHDGRALALPSRDVSETFVAGMLGMTSPEAERRMMEDALAHRETRNAAAPPVWTGAASGDGPKRAATRSGYTPEGF